MLVLEREVNQKIIIGSHDGPVVIKGPFSITIVPAIFGAIIVLVILLMPRGILGVLQQRYRLPRIV